MLIEKQSGFTLIEALIYIGLLGIMLGGGIVGVYNILEGSGRTRGAMYREQDAYFITRKIDSVLVEATSVSSPSDNVVEIASAAGSVDLFIDDENQINMRRPSSSAYPLHDFFMPASSISATYDATTKIATIQFILDEHEYSVSHILR